MRSTLSLILLLALTATTLAKPAPSLTERDSATALIGTFNDKSCAVGQKDWSDAVPIMPGSGTCHEPPGDGMKVWWVKKGCLVLLFPGDRKCKVNPKTVDETDKCVDTKGYMSWTAYCH